MVSQSINTLSDPGIELETHWSTVAVASTFVSYQNIFNFGVVTLVTTLPGRRIELKSTQQSRCVFLLKVPKIFIATAKKKRK